MVGDLRGGGNPIIRNIQPIQLSMYDHIQAWHVPKIPGTCFSPPKKPLREPTHSLKARKNQGTGPTMTQTHTNTHFSQKGHVPKFQDRVFWRKKPLRERPR